MNPVSESQPTASNGDQNEELWSALENFVAHIEDLLIKRWDAWALNHEERDLHQVVGALLSRQVTLTTEMARNPGSWTAHIAPLILRPMVESLITLGWIFADVTERPRRFILYGLGQDKLLLEHQKSILVEQGKDPKEDQTIEEREGWLNGQRYIDLIEVNVGEWAGANLRKMAQETGYLDLHRIDYARWSGATHNMWQHVVRFNLQSCQNPLHGFHRLPHLPQLNLDPAYLQWSADYLGQTFTLFDDKTGMNLDEPNPVEVLDRELQRIPKPMDDDENDR